MSNLLEKASIITTPTAYDVGFINSVKPEEALGSESVINGDFSNGSANWNIEAAWTISNGVANGNGANGTSQELTQGGGITNGKTYLLTYEVKNYVSGSVKTRGPSTPLRSENKVYKVLYVANGPLTFVGINFYGSITNISLKEIIGGDFTFTRNTIATRVNASGLIESVVNNLPRIDYTGGGCGSWLLEPQRTNLIPRSNEFNFWNNLQNRSIVTSNSITSPDGTVNGTKITQNVSTQNARIRFSGILTIGTEYTFSVYAKKGNHDKLIMNISGVSTTFTLTDDWVRYEITETAPNNTFVDVGITQGVVGDFIYIYGAQAEEANYKTSYISTSGTAVTRNEDLATDAGNSNLISSTEGVLYAEIAALSNEEDANYRIIALDDGNDVNNYVLLGIDPTVNAFYAAIGGVVIAFTIPADATTFLKLAIRYKNNDSKFFVNGSQVGVTNTTATIPSGLNRLAFDLVGTVPFQGNARCVAVFKEALTDAELTALTTI